jgi:predicted ArsR family transcriptional regulator
MAVKAYRVYLKLSGAGRGVVAVYGLLDTGQKLFTSQPYTGREDLAKKVKDQIGDIENFDPAAHKRAHQLAKEAAKAQVTK